jgi:DNA topoisomerase VI subunit A
MSQCGLYTDTTSDNKLLKLQTAGVKGLMAGAVVINRRDGSKIDLANAQSGILVPSMEEVLSVDLSRVRWVLVIEKEVRRSPDRR